jgi:hypothetical protein
MAGLDPAIAEFMKTYGVEADEIWLLPGGRAHAVKHKALERIARNLGMVVVSLELLALDQTEKTAAIKATVKLGDQTVVTTGEAAPSNNRNAYPLAMAEKRALDRAYLKLLAVHADIYSESEADEFTDPGQGEKGRLLPSSQYARNEASKLMLSMRNCNSVDMLEQWGKAHREEIRAQPEKHASAIREAYAELLDELKVNAHQ